jgi:formate hydrogenlyase transcriptional activator
VFPIHIAPLRERRDDIPGLVRHFARHYARRMGRRIKWVPATTMEILTALFLARQYSELQNLIELVIRSAGEGLQVAVLDMDGSLQFRMKKLGIERPTVSD